jgi:hypothetical protein
LKGACFDSGFLGFEVTSTLNVSDEFELLYMPHCPAGLYHEELYLRWTEKLLAQTLIVGNSFRFLQFSFSCFFVDLIFSNYFFRLAPDRAPIIRKTEAFVQETELPNASFVENCFNDTAILSFPVKSDQLTPVLASERSHNDPEFRV